jgi:hypothetical protein
MVRPAVELILLGAVLVVGVVSTRVVLPRVASRILVTTAIRRSRPMCECGREWDDEYQETLDRVRDCVDKISEMIDENDCILQDPTIGEHSDDDVTISFMVWPVDLYMVLKEAEKIVREFELEEIFVAFASTEFYGRMEYISIVIYFMGVPCCAG